MPDPQAFILVAAYMRVAATTIGGSPAWAAHDYRGGNVGSLQGKKPHRRSLLVLLSRVPRPGRCKAATSEGWMVYARE